MKHKILSLKVYEAVLVDGRMERFFSTQSSPTRKSYELEILEGIGVAVKTATDHVIVPFPNISGIYLDTKEKAEKREERKQDLAKPAKAQKVSKQKVDPQGAKR